MSEDAFKHYIIEGMGRRWDYQRHEDRYSEGIPDFSYALEGVNGWIETKYVKSFPSDPKRELILHHFTPSQVNWLRKRGSYGGHCFVFIQVGKEYFLFSSYYARTLRHGANREFYTSNSVAWWENSIDFEKLAFLLDRA